MEKIRIHNMVYLAEINTDPCYEAPNKKQKAHLIGKI